MCWTLLRAHFNACLAAQAKMGQSWAENMPANRNSIVLLYLKYFTTRNVNNILFSA